MEVFDVSVPVRPGMVTYPGDPAVRLERVASIAAGDGYNLSRLDFGVHSGTHVDAPLHFVDGAAGAEALPLDVLVGPCVVVDGLDPATVPRITTAMPVRPDTPYGVAKALGEAAARYYAEEHGMSVLCLRIGTLNRLSRPSVPRHFATLLTHDDMARLVRCCIEAPADLRFGVFYGVSANRWRIWEIDDAHRAIGYRPRDDAEAWRDLALAAPPSSTATASRLRKLVRRGLPHRTGRPARPT
jgi:hypothetical protein